MSVVRKPAESGFVITLLLLGLLCIVALLAAVATVAWYTWHYDSVVTEKFEGKRWELPARVYARSLELYPGMTLDAGALQKELQRLHYRQIEHRQIQNSRQVQNRQIQNNHEAAPGTELTAGSYLLGRQQITVFSRGFAFADGSEPARRLSLHFAGNVLVTIQDENAQALDLVRLEPLDIGGIYPRHHEDRVLVRLPEVPSILVRGLVAVEDRHFYQHHGLSPRGMTRAMWVNVTHGRWQQGGSTLTQQLIKNFYLSDERTLKRKLREALMALILEYHYSKNEILETYLNEVYLGQSGRYGVHGIGRAAVHYFGVPVGELDIAQSALLVGLVKGPSYYDPRRFPQRAQARRNTVLQVWREQKVIDEASYASAVRRPLAVLAQPGNNVALYPAFLDLVRKQLARDYKPEDLSGQGLRIFTTLEPRLQDIAEQALNRHLAVLARNGKRQKLQAAMVVANVDNGELLALVGGHGTFTGYNRALVARRPIGSLVKPAVYLTALQSSQYSLLSPLDDSAVSLPAGGGRNWYPQNYDHVEHGSVPLRQALAQSYNLATVKLGMAVGVDKVVDTLHILGVQAALSPYPSLLLGTPELTPLEVLDMYRVFAANGFYSPPRAIAAVLDAGNKPLSRYAFNIEQRIDPVSVYLLQQAMQEVMISGTAAGVLSRLPEGINAGGKTGTSNDLRDAWFAGWAGDMVASVWVGNDDNSSMGLSGASGALPIWSAFMAAAKPVSQPVPEPEGISFVWLNGSSGEPSAEGCEGAVRVPVRSEQVPAEPPGSCSGGGLSGFLQRLLH